MKKIALLFDLDGTLLDTLEDLCDAVNCTMREYNSPERTLEEVRRFVGHGAADLISKALDGGRDNPEYDAALAFFRKYYADHADIKTRPYDGVIDILKRLGEIGVPCAVVSNKPDDATVSLCKKHFGSLIIESIGDREGMPRKPAPDKVIKMIETLGCESAIYVGDSETDVLTAKNACIPCICVTWGFRDREQMEAVGGEIFCREAGELEGEIMRLLEAGE
ncbi:MAG: HAD family hydrolase [Ruminococcaceae bacterium]|nr:HAD family hydrolase [Oscillospiraceae bacterium]